MDDVTPLANVVPKVGVDTSETLPEAGRSSGLNRSLIMKGAPMPVVESTPSTRAPAFCSIDESVFMS